MILLKDIAKVSPGPSSSAAPSELFKIGVDADDIDIPAYYVPTFEDNPGMRQVKLILLVN